MAEPPQPHGFHEWSVPGSNRRPSACKADALPTELTPRACQSVGEGQERLAKYRPMTGFCLFAQSDGLRAEARDAPRQRSENARAPTIAARTEATRILATVCLSQRAKWVCAGQLQLRFWKFDLASPIMHLRRGGAFLWGGFDDRDWAFALVVRRGDCSRCGRCGGSRCRRQAGERKRFRVAVRSAEGS